MLKYLLISFSFLSLVMLPSVAKAQEEQPPKKRLYEQILGGDAEKEKNKKYSYLYDTSLITGIKKQDVDRVKFLLLASVNPNETNDEKITPLVIAAGLHSNEIVTALLDKDAKVNSQSKYNLTPLMSAAAEGETENVRTLLEYGADANMKDQNGMTPLIHAVKNKQLDSARALLALKKLNRDERDNTGTNALLYAVHNGDIEMVNLLLTFGANPNVADNLGNTPLHYAAKDNNTEMAELLIVAAANVDAVNNNGQSVSDFARGGNISGLLDNPSKAQYNIDIDFSNWTKEELDAYITRTERNLAAAKVARAKFADGSISQMTTAPTQNRKVAKTAKPKKIVQK